MGFGLVLGLGLPDVEELARGAEEFIEQLSRGLVALGACERLRQGGRAQRGDEPSRRVEQMEVVEDERSHREPVGVRGPRTADAAGDANG